MTIRERFQMMNIKRKIWFKKLLDERKLELTSVSISKAIENKLEEEGYTVRIYTVGYGVFRYLYTEITW